MAVHPEGRFKAAQTRCATVDGIDALALRRWLQKAKTIQWNHRTMVKRKGQLEHSI